MPPEWRLLGTSGKCVDSERWEGWEVWSGEGSWLVVKIRSGPDVMWNGDMWTRVQVESIDIAGFPFFHICVRLRRVRLHLKKIQRGRKVCPIFWDGKIESGCQQNRAWDHFSVQEVSWELKTSFTDREGVFFSLKVPHPREKFRGLSASPVRVSLREGLYLAAISTLSPPLSTAYRGMGQVCVHACMTFGWLDG